MSSFLAEVQQRRESRQRDAKARRADRRQAAAGQRGAAASEAVRQARKARRMETEAAMLRRRAAAPEERGVSAAATCSVEKHLSPDPVMLQLPQGSVRVTTGRKRPAPSADPVPSASLPLEAGQHGHHDASTPEAASDSSQSDSSAPGERSGSPGIGDGSDADSATAFEIVSSIDAGGSGAQEPQEGGEYTAARLQHSGDEPRSSAAALARDPSAAVRAWGAAAPQVDADPAGDDDSGGSPGMRKLRRGMLRRSRELLALRRHGPGSSAMAAGWDNAAAGPAALGADPARGSEAARVPSEHAEDPGQHTDADGVSCGPATTVRFWLYPPSSSCSVLPSSAEPGAQEHPDMQDLESKQQQAGHLASRGANFAAQLLGAQRSRWH